MFKLPRTMAVGLRALFIVFRPVAIPPRSMAEVSRPMFIVLRHLAIVFLPVVIVFRCREGVFRCRAIVFRSRVIVFRCRNPLPLLSFSHIFKSLMCYWKMVWLASFPSLLRLLSNKLWGYIIYWYRFARTPTKAKSKNQESYFECNALHVAGYVRSETNYCRSFNGYGSSVVNY